MEISWDVSKLYRLSKSDEKFTWSSVWKIAMVFIIGDDGGSDWLDVALGPPVFIA